MLKSAIHQQKLLLTLLLFVHGCRTQQAGLPHPCHLERQCSDVSTDLDIEFRCHRGPAGILLAVSALCHHIFDQLDGSFVVQLTVLNVGQDVSSP